MNKLTNKEGKRNIIANSIILFFSLIMFFSIVILFVNSIPEQATPVINMTDHPYNTTNANITAWNISSINATKNIYNWFVNNQSIAVLNMPFEANGGNELLQAVDYSGYGNNGSVNGTTYNSTGGHDGKGSFQSNALLNYVNISYSSSLNFTNGMTISLWTNKEINKWAGLVSSGDPLSFPYEGFYLRFRSNNDQLDFRMGNGTGTSNYWDIYQGLLNNTWYHVAITYNNTHMIAYVNGLNVSTNRWTSTPHFAQNGYYIGVRSRNNSVGPTDPIQGKIDEVMILNRSLSTQEIKALYENKTNIIVEQETQAGETWWVNVTPNDGTQDGNSLKSNEIYIRQTMSQSAPKINATDNPNNTTNANLTAYNQSTVGEGVVKNIYNWFVNNASIAVLNMPFEAHSGDETLQALDYSGYGNNGSVSATWNVSGGYDRRGAYLFDGIDDNISIKHAGSVALNTNLTELTVSAWVNTRNFNNGTISTPIISDWNTWNVGAQKGFLLRTFGSATNLQWSFTVNNGTVYDSASSALLSYDSFNTTYVNKWVHVAGVFKNNEYIKIYINGVNEGTQAVTFDEYVPENSTPIWIGYTGTNTGYLNGTIDEVMIYNRSLSAQQIKALYENKTNIIVSNELVRDHTWWVNITPNDGTEDGNSLKSNEMTIQNGTYPIEFYVSFSAGNDSSNGTDQSHAWKTITKLNTQALNPGDIVYFKSGDTWRCPTDAYITFKSGNSTKNITYTSYGTGNKPLFLGSLNVTSTNNWTNYSENVWNYTFAITASDVGNLIFNDGTSFGIKNWTINETKGNQGYFYFNATTDTLYLYSTSNPATYYNNIEIALSNSIFNIGGNNYITVDNIALKYGDYLGVDMDGNHDIIIRNSEVSYIGGGTSSEPQVRWGNAIQSWNGGYNILVENNTIWEIWDAALTTQGGNSNSLAKSNVTFKNNQVWNVVYCFEYFNGNQTITNNVLFDHNTCVNTGNNLWKTYGNQRGGYGAGSSCFRIGANANIGNTKGINITNNICYNSTKNIVEIDWPWNGSTSDLNLTINRNLYYQVPTITFDWFDIIYTTLASYKVASTKDTNSQQSDPLFYNLASHDFHPYSDSTACTMSSTGSYVGALSCLSIPSVSPSGGGAGGGDPDQNPSDDTFGASQCDEYADTYKQCYYLNVNGTTCMPGCLEGYQCDSNYRCVVFANLTQSDNLTIDLMQGSKNIAEKLMDMYNLPPPTKKELYMVFGGFILVILIGIYVSEKKRI